MFSYCYTDECYGKTCADKKIVAFLIVVLIVILGLLAFSIYLVAKPVQCIEKENPSLTNQRSFKYLKPKCMETSILRYPQVAAIVEKDSKTFICSGSIVSKSWVITAAHCLVLCKERTCRDLKVRAGSTYTSRDGTVYSILQYEMHPEFNELTFKNDIGLVKVNTSQFINIAKINSKSIKHGTQAKLLGWSPHSKVDANYKDNILKMINLAINPEGLCKYYMKGSYVKKFTLHKHMLCGLHPSKGGGCYTSAGAPFMDNDTLLGISVFNQICYGCDHHISIIVDISYYGSFIKNFTQFKVNSG